MANTDNPRNGAAFERAVKQFFAKQGILLQSGIKIPIGIGQLKKERSFDLGCHDLRVLIECKRHTWTKGEKRSNVPSAKMATWNEAMYYFSLAPREYRKVLFVLKDQRAGESLANYYIRTYKHLIPSGVEIHEYDLHLEDAFRVFPSG